MDLFRNLHWFYKIILGGFILYSALTLVKWLGLGVLQLLQILTLTVVFSLLVLTGIGLMKQGTIDGCLGYVNSLWSWMKELWKESLDEARDNASGSNPQSNVS